MPRPAVGQGITWKPLGEPGFGSRVSSIIVSPHDSRRVLVGGESSGIVISEDQGETWQPTIGLSTQSINEFTWN
ncbi:MAG: hypothetical protein ABJA67_18685, partial [Chthonomonadales bacterium]